jgi:WD40 repeat protein
MQTAAVIKHDGPVSDVAISSDGKTVWMCAGSAVLQGDIASGATQTRLVPTQQPLLAIASRRDAVIAVSAFEAFLTKLQDDVRMSRGFGSDDHRSFTAIGVSADGRTWMAGFSDGQCQLFEWGLRIATKPVATAPIIEIHPHVDGVHYVSCSADGQVQVFSFEGDLRLFPVSHSPLAGISPMPDGKCAAVATADGVKLIELTTGSVLRDWPMAGDPPTAVAATPDGRRIIWGTASGVVSSRSVDTTTQRPLPVGEDRLQLAYLAVLELPELWAMLESLDESALAGLGAQLQLGPDQDVLQALQSRRHGVAPPLWTAWITSLYPSKVGKPQIPK